MIKTIAIALATLLVSGQAFAQSCNTFQWSQQNSTTTCSNGLSANTFQWSPNNSTTTFTSPPPPPPSYTPNFIPAVPSSRGYGYYGPNR
jgi:hypothetical protein